MERELPSLKSWLFCQVGREDAIGILARGYLEAPENDERNFDTWWNSLGKTKASQKSATAAQKEYETALEQLGNGDCCQTFPYSLTLPGLKEMHSRSSDWHQANPEIHPRDYLDFLREKHFKENIKGRTVIYLDTNFWIGLRHVYMSDKLEKPEFTLLFLMLIELVEKKKIVCPLSYPLYVELLKQTDPATRTATAELITTLSEDVSLRHPSELLQYEATKLVTQHTDIKASDHHRWTASGFSAGELLPQSPGFSELDTQRCQKVHIDHIWNVPFSEQIRSLPIGQITTGTDILMKTLNSSFNALKEADLSRKEIRDTGISLALQAWNIIDLIKTFARETQDRFPEEVERALERLKQSNPSVDPLMIAPVQIIGGINAVYVQSGKKQLKVNDLLDSLHASFALPYCDVFAGDSGLCHTLVESKNQFDEKYSVTVCRGDNELISFLCKSFPGDLPTKQSTKD